MYWLAEQKDQMAKSTIQRFMPRYWTVNFPRPMMAALSQTTPSSMRVDLVFYRLDDLCGLIWDSEDTVDHPLLKYETSRDYSDTVLSFHWQSTGILPLDDVYGPTLTIEGRDEGGALKTWYVRLANYATGAGNDAIITLDFDDLAGGFLLPSQADPVYPKDIDRMFISMVPPGFDGVATGPLAAAVEGSVVITDLSVESTTSTLEVGDIFVKPHDLRIANGYDDTYPLAPERVIWNMLQLGYRNWINHYVGMSHYYNLTWDAGEGRYIVDPAKAKLNVATQAWQDDYFKLSKEYDYKVITSLSYELFADNVPLSWEQKDHAGNGARTGWVPPSTLLAPTNTDAMDYLRDVFEAFADIQETADGDHYYQVGEPWWWVSFDGSDIPHFYDDVTTALYTSETGQAVPTKHQVVTESIDAAQQAYLDWLGVKLGQSTLYLRDEIKTLYPAAEVGVLFYTPQVLRDDAPMLETVNFPVTEWAYPAFDFFQVEDYDYVIEGAWGLHRLGVEKVATELAYPQDKSHYFSGFNLLPETTTLWRNIDLATGDGFQRNYEEVFLWAYPQVVRDGVVYNMDQVDDMSGFHEVQFPPDISYGASGGPVFSTKIVEMASGFEQRNRDWLLPRMTYDVSTGLRSENDLMTLIAFFRARAGRAFGFRFRDWSDYKSGGIDQDTAPTDQIIGTGDDLTTSFALTKRYQSGDVTETRPIVKPVSGSVQIAFDGTEQTTGWQLDDTTGIVTFDVPVPSGVQITAGYEFDVPVRFNDDLLNVSLDTFQAGQIPSISLVEIRQGGANLL